MTTRQEFRQRSKKRRINVWRWLLIAMLGLALVGGGYGIYHWWHLRHQTMMARYPVTGAAIDQSAGFIDFQALSKTGLKFVYLKTTVGNRYVDDDFSGNYSRSSGSPLKVGVYLTYSPQSSINSQLNYFEHQIGHDTGTLPIMIAVTDAGASFGSAQAVKRTANRLSVMLETLRQDYAQPVGVWVSTQGYHALQKQLPNAGLTLEDASLKPRNQNAVQFIMYDADGSIEVAGTKQSMSLMVYNGSKQKFSEYDNE